MTSFKRGDIVLLDLGNAGVDQVRVQRRLGALPPDRLDAVLEALCRVLGVEPKHLATGQSEV
jgi:hypothetical protein